jgi:hypothetical protein
LLTSCLTKCSQGRDYERSRQGWERGPRRNGQAPEAILAGEKLGISAGRSRRVVACEASGATAVTQTGSHSRPHPTAASCRRMDRSDAEIGSLRFCHGHEACLGRMDIV